MYTLTRSQAAELLGVSTRTIDRYVKSWRLSYKKIANKVLLKRDELMAMKQDYDMLHQNESTVTELVKEKDVVASVVSQSSSVAWLDHMIDQKIEKFFLVFKEKEKLLEDKNRIIFMLQQRIGELETKIQSMVALPDYNSEKQVALLEKKKLEQKIGELQKNLGVEKTKSMISVGFFMLIVGLALVFFLINQ